MRMVVLGAGLQGSACAFDLLGNPRVEKVVLADQRVDRLPPFLDRYADDPRLETVQVDARDREQMRGVIAGAAAVMNALPYYFNLPMTELAIEAGAHYCDLGGNTAIVFDQRKLDDAAKAKGVSAIPDCGLAPGMVNILAAEGMRQLDETDTVRIYVGGLPQNPEPPLNYQIVYSLEGVLDYYTTLSWVVRDGKPTQVEALTELEPVEFEGPVGTLEAFHTAGGLSAMPWTYEGKVRSMEYKTLRYPGHAELMKAIRSLGLLELQPIDVKGQRIVPRDVFIASVEPKLRKPEGKDLVALRVTVAGRKDGADRRITYDLVDRYDEANHITAMERTTGFSLAITGFLQATGRTLVQGVALPDQAVPAQDYIDALAGRGVRISTRAE